MECVTGCEGESEPTTEREVPPTACEVTVCCVTVVVYGAAIVRVVVSGGVPATVEAVDSLSSRLTVACELCTVAVEGEGVLTSVTELSSHSKNCVTYAASASTLCDGDSSADALFFTDMFLCLLLMESKFAARVLKLLNSVSKVRYLRVDNQCVATWRLTAACMTFHLVLGSCVGHSPTHNPHRRHSCSSHCC